MERKKLLDLEQRRRAYARAIIVGLIAVVTLGKISQAYGEFLGEALSAAWVWAIALLALNLTLGSLLILLLLQVVKPTDWVPYGVVVAAGLTSFLATPIAISTFAASPLPGSPESIKVSDLYNPLDRIIASKLERPVRKAKHEEIEKLVAAYAGRSQAGKRCLRDQVDAGLAAASKTAEERAQITSDVGKLLDGKGAYRPRLRAVALILYSAELREVVQDAARRARCPGAARGRSSRP